MKSHEFLEKSCDFLRIPLNSSRNPMKFLRNPLICSRNPLVFFKDLLISFWNPSILFKKSVDFGKKSFDFLRNPSILIRHLYEFLKKPIDFPGLSWFGQSCLRSPFARPPKIHSRRNPELKKCSETLATPRENKKFETLKAKWDFLNSDGGYMEIHPQETNMHHYASRH